MKLGTGTYPMCCPRTVRLVCVLVDTLPPLYPRTLVRYAGTCMFASLQWGRWPGARFPLPKTWVSWFLAVAAASPARQSACPSRSPPLAGSLGDCDCSDTVKRTQSIHPFILPSLPSHNLAESGTVLHSRANHQSLDLRDFPWVWYSLPVWCVLILRHDCLVCVTQPPN